MRFTPRKGLVHHGMKDASLCGAKKKELNSISFMMVF